MNRFWRKRSVQSRQEPEVVGRKVKMQLAVNEKPEMSQYLSENTKMGNFNQQRTLSGSFFVIPERLASIRAVDLVFIANKQTNTLNYVYRYRILYSRKFGRQYILQLLHVVRYLADCPIETIKCNHWRDC